MAEDTEFLSILDACFDRVFQRGDSVEACLASYPEHALQLESYLRLAERTRRTLDYAPSPSTKAVARAALHRAIQEQEAQPRRWNPWRAFQQFAAWKARSYRWAALATATALVFALASSGMVAAAAGSEPDQPLYPVKRTVERARLAFSSDQQAKARLHAAYAERRVREMAAMAARGNPQQIEALRSDLHGNLRQIRQATFPGRGPVVARPTDRSRTFFPGQVPPYVPRYLPRGLQGQEAQELQELHRTLQAHMQLMELRFHLATRDAPEPTKERLRQALASAREEYQELLVAFQQAAAPESR